MHRLLFQNQNALKRKNLLSYGEVIGLDIDRFIRYPRTSQVASLVHDPRRPAGRTKGTRDHRAWGLKAMPKAQ
jgi:hypothetical protein